MKGSKIALLALALLCFDKGNAQTLSGKAIISVLTLGPGQAELYSAFGHSAIRVSDSLNNWELIYNYGVFDFNQPNFYLNFARGKLYYKLGLEPYERFRDAYIDNNRNIVEQTLNLDSIERQKLFDYLQWNAQPENSNYYYNYIYDNCATKIRDVMHKVFDGGIEYDYSFVQEGLTFRELMDVYSTEQPWGDLGIDICLGIGIDRTASGFHYMYLPDYIEKSFDGAQMKSGGTTKSLVSSSKVIYQAKEEPSRASGITPKMAFIAAFLFFGFISFKDLKRGKRSNWVDILLLSVSGVIGWLLLFLWFLTDHISQYNFNLLWALPLHFPIALLLLKNEKLHFLKPYFLVTAIILGGLICFWGYWPQNLHNSLIPFVLILLIRSILIWREPISSAI